jgi:bifunctional non-homologous end joining protein LigD
MFCEGVARAVCREASEIATVERNVANRGGRVYVDFLQNRRGQTIPPPYVVRPVQGANVSMPLAWDELTSDLSPGQFTIQTAPDRLARLGDLCRGVLTNRQDLMPAITALADYMKR